MSDYAFNQTAVNAGQAEAHNAAILARELAQWAEKPDRQLAYYHFPAEKGGGIYRRNFRPDWTGAYVTLWPGNVIGRIVRAHVYTHNFGSRMVSLHIIGTNGASYYGRASWDWGQCINLRRVTGK